MRCGRCGNENPVGAECCNLCGSEFESGVCEKGGKEVKHSKVKPAILKTLKYSVNVLIVLALILLPLYLVFSAVWKSDAPPLEDDYTIADLRSAPAECERSYELLMSLSSKGRNTPEAAEIGLSEEDVNVIIEVKEDIRDGSYAEIVDSIKENAEGIEEAWRNGQKGRDIIFELNTFEEIADLTECSMDAYAIPLANLRRLAYLYHAYIFVEIGWGNEEEAVAELIELDMVFRKLSVNARSAITKYICYVVLNLDITTANFIVNNPGTSQETLELLAGHFEVFSEEQMSLRNIMIFEYLMWKNFYDTQIIGDSKMAFLLKWNSTLRLYKNHIEELVYRAEGKEQADAEKLSVWPRFWPFKMDVELDSEGNLPTIYTFYNNMGPISLLTLPALEKSFELRTRLEVHDDLLQIVLGKRLGKEVSLKARAYSDEYVIDIEEGIIYSPGFDGEANTEDDIKLMINPEVLGLVE
ncbi:MAG: hypothetical protein MUO22_06535 [Sedimentisphaerales bacterium]|nr:hypothetical protein [Sedimentisphaerales bacterium]